MKKIGAFALLLLTVMMSVSCTQESSADYYLFVGTYTSESSEGIYVYKFNSTDGSIRYVSKATGISNPSYLAISPDQKRLYAVNESGAEDGSRVSSFSFSKDDGRLTYMNSQPSQGRGPCYVAVDASGKAVFVANYSGGSLAMLPVRSDGSLAEPKVTVHHEGSGINKNRQQSPHVHCAYISPDNSRIFVADLGTDKVVGYRFREGDVLLETSPSSIYKTEPGAGPRHLTFHPDGRYAYLINELNGTVVAFSYRDGKLEELQTVSTLPSGYTGAISGADIHVSPDGRYLYASNREDLNNIVIFSIEQGSGRLSYAGQHSSGGVHPRNFMIDPTGQYLLAANRNTDNIVVFERNRETGKLSETGTEIEVSMPVCLKMIPARGTAE